MNLLVDTFLLILIFRSLALLRQIVILGDENAGGRPPVDGDARGLLKSPASQLEIGMRSRGLCADEGVKRFSE